MKTLKPIKKMSKEGREKRVLLALVEYYIKSGKPVGSSILKEVDVGDLSSATIRNYFARLEEEGYLIQQHISGGRLPTEKAFRLYAQEHIESRGLAAEIEKNCRSIDNNDSRKITSYLQLAAEELSRLTNSAIFLSAPRFDHDFITAIKFISIDNTHGLCVIITDFGVIKTEVIYVEKKLSAFSIKRIEDYFQWRLTGHNPPHNIEIDEEQLAQKIYNELLVRYIVGYSNFTDYEIYRTGFSKLITYPEFYDATQLATSLSLFENSHSMRLLLKECSKHNAMKFWIGTDLEPYSTLTPNCSILAMPYRINSHPVGAIGLLSSMRIPYDKLFALLYLFADIISETVTRNIYKFKIKYRQPQQSPLSFDIQNSQLLHQTEPLLLEDMNTILGVE
ncbi:MAG: heat-inducible transcriptional repressor HrcA [Parachlamydiaceae bacterium]|nr:heat-inducible transcriptional repressor HrcA [Parachlamydiaceae bacterium]